MSACNTSVVTKKLITAVRAILNEHDIQLNLMNLRPTQEQKIAIELACLLINNVDEAEPAERRLNKVQDILGDMWKTIHSNLDPLDPSIRSFTLFQERITNDTLELLYKVSKNTNLKDDERNLPLHKCILQYAMRMVQTDLAVILKDCAYLPTITEHVPRFENVEEIIGLIHPFRYFLYKQHPHSVSLVDHLFEKSLHLSAYAEEYPYSCVKNTLVENHQKIIQFLKSMSDQTVQFSMLDSYKIATNYRNLYFANIE